MGKLLLFLIFVALLLFFFLERPSKNNDEKKILEAKDSYEKALQAKNTAEREMHLNQALSIYLDLAGQGNLEYSTGKLYYNLANTQFQLGTYPTAAYYYYQALKLSPRSEQIKNNLNIALQKLNISQPPEEPTFKRIFFFHYYLSLPERLTLFFYTCLTLLLLSSTYLWFPKTWLKPFIFFLSLFAILLLLSALYTRFLSPVEGVLVKSTLTYRDAGTTYAKVQEEPLPPGIKVEVLHLSSDGSWLKILLPSGAIGYIPQESIRLLE